MTEPRSEVGRRSLVAAASAHLTETIALQLPFEALGPFKTALKQFFSDEPWSPDDAERLSDLVTAHVDAGSWTAALDDDLTLVHSIEAGRYVLTVAGDIGDGGPSLWDRIFDGPIMPGPTPHPKKVKFAFGGEPAPGIWYLAGDEPDDQRARRLLGEPGVTDVMIAGDFVTVGLDRQHAWEDRLDPMLELVGQLFSAGSVVDAPLSRDELVSEGQAIRVESDQLHLLDPDDPSHASRLQTAMKDPDARVRRTAVAVLAGSSDEAVAGQAVQAAYEDSSRIVRRMAIDAAGDTEAEIHRSVLEKALTDDDAWTRWRAVRALGDLGLASSTEAVGALADDDDFQVRFEVAVVLRSD